MNFGKPDEAVALTNYARLADGYDTACRRLGPIREEAVALLGSKPKCWLGEKAPFIAR